MEGNTEINFELVRCSRRLVERYLDLRRGEWLGSTEWQRTCHWRYYWLSSL